MPTRDPTVAAIRRFNRFYTRHVGALDERHLASAFTLAEARVLYELAHRDAPTATEIGRDLGLDAGYLSRLLTRFEQRGYVVREASPQDARRSHLRLTDDGRATFAGMETRAHDDVARHVAPLVPADRRRLLASMQSIEALLARAASGDAPEIVLREPRPGDMGWVVARHGAIYHQEYQWDARFEALCLQIVADFVREHDRAYERAWIAERDGDNVGCIFLVRHPTREGVAKLRLLLVEPSARGLGIGERLVEACIAFARDAGYHTITLWTNDVLGSARRIYEAKGFTLVAQGPHEAFGHQLVEQTWELPLR